MALVGDAIIAARQTIPDMPGTINTPGAGPVVIAVSSAGSLLGSGQWILTATMRNQWGETAASVESTINISAGQGIQVSSPPFTGGANIIRVYGTQGASGTEQVYVESSVLPFVINGFTNNGVPPTRNTAWLPDSDGGLIGAAAMYGWLNDGLSMIARETGGLLDYAGVGSVIGQPLYVIPGQWNEITSVWYDGYWVLGGDRAGFFRRNSVTSSILSGASMSVINNQNIIEVYPQPARTSAATTLAAAMAVVDTSATLANASGFLLPFGFLQVDSEIMAYATINGNVLSGLIRGLGGSVASAHAVNAPVTELNIFWSGKRQMTQMFAPGQSASVLPIPAGWEVLLAQYMAGRAKLVEHDSASWKEFMGDMRGEIKTWGLSTKGVVRRRQVGGGASPLVYGPTKAGGLIIN